MTQVVATPSRESTDISGLHPVHPAGPAVRIRLNPFQLLMRRWTTLHPYNAGQVMEVTGRPDVDLWRRVAAAVLSEMGLGPASFESGDRYARFTPPEEVSVEQVPQDLQSFFNEELNRPFAPKEAPIRFAVLPGAGGGERSHYFAAVYDHWIADSRAMRELMHRIFDRYRQVLANAGRAEPQSGTLMPLTLQAPHFRTLFRAHSGRLVRCRAIRESIKNIWRHRRSFRINIRNPLDFTSKFLVRPLPEGLIDRVHAFAKKNEASVNDVFVAGLAQTMGEYTAERRLRRRKRLLHFPRRQIGIGTIVDIRDAASQPLDNVFNLYLSSFTVVMSGPEKRPLQALTQQVGRTTSRLKKTYATVRGFWALAMARFCWDLYRSPRVRAQLLHKMVPVAAGISNVKMTGTWVDCTANRPAENEPAVLDYLRISPTGPLIPLVFTLTTIGSRLSLCVTYRTTAFSEEEVNRLATDFVGRLQKSTSSA